ncbi:MAG: associated Golgi protein-related protein [Caproiciproducens sp.]|nr:associated Golgi protein-related protein [Caproiciproducens sp.]
MNYFVDLFLHLDKYLNLLLSQYSVWAYILLFLVIFIETGLVITPFLPGDSLLFAAGAIAAAGGPINISVTIFILYVAAISGDTLNYHIGHLLREKIKKRENIRFIKMEYIDKAQAFLKRNGGKTITIARFIPIIRTFAPFVAGVGEMPYRSFLGYNVIGGISWVTLFFGIGYFFGNISYVKTHFGLIIIAVIGISVIPAIVAFIRNKLKEVKSGSK